MINPTGALPPGHHRRQKRSPADASGNYSEYAQPGYNGVGQTLLRGLQTTDASGRVTFRTIYPGWYQGRSTHIHVQVFVNGAAIKTTQVAFPENVTSTAVRDGDARRRSLERLHGDADNRGERLTR
jgi:protocatechuate 3,4-dioxygenase beta subunit